MAKKKDSVALFEIISKVRAETDEPDMAVPDWMDGDKHAAQDKAQPKQAKAAPAVAAKEPVAAADKGRVKLSLDYTTCMLAAAGLIVALAVAFGLGRITAPTSGQVAEAGLAGPESAAGALPGSRSLPERIPGKYYMVIQDLLGDDELKRTEAHRIAEYCTDNGEPADVNLYEGHLVVWSLKPFNGPGGQDVGNHAQSVEQLGQRYFRKYRSYDFRQRKDGQLQPRMLLYRPTGG